jgi:hypothetical protein
MRLPLIRRLSSQIFTILQLHESSPTHVQLLWRASHLYYLYGQESIAFLETLTHGGPRPAQLLTARTTVKNDLDRDKIVPASRFCFWGEIVEEQKRAALISH